MLDEVNSDLEDAIVNLKSDLDTEFVLEESLENELASADEPLNLLVAEANVAENPTIEKTSEEGRSKAEKDVEGKSTEKGKGKGKDKERSKGKSKET